MRKTFITNVKLKGFKSFNKHTNIQLGPNFNCIAGANGSGKSNVLDALCFVLGRLSSKSIRADNHAALIHKKGDTRVGGGEVTITLDNSSGIFGIDSPKIELTREITSAGKTKFWINRKRATRTQVLEFLEMSKIRPEGHNIILQGDIDAFTRSSAIDKRKLIEEIAGIGVYERKKESALRELEKVEAKLREVEIVMNEKKTYLNSLEDDKKTAEKSQSYNSELKSAKSTELNLRVDSAMKRKMDVSARLEKIEKKRRSFDKGKEDLQKKVDILNDKIEGVEKEIEKKGGEDQLNLQKSIENLKIDLENAKNLVSSSENEIRRIEERKKQLSKNLDDIKGKIKISGGDLKKLATKMNNLQLQEEDIKKALGISGGSVQDLETSLEDKESELDKLKNKSLQVRAESNKLRAELEIFKVKSESVTEKIKEVEEIEKRLGAVADRKDKYREILVEINAMSDKDTELFNEIKEMRKEMLEVESQLTKIQIELNSSHELLMRDKAIGAILKNKRKLGMIYGTVAELGEVDKQYSTALKVAAGGRLKNIVVKDENVAIKCLNYLREKRLGVATFLPLNKIRASSSSSVPSGSGVIGLARDLVDCKPEFKKVFANILRNTLIVEDTKTAKSLGIGQHSMVSLEGDVFTTGGSISGGYRRDTGISFSQKKQDGRMEEIVEVIDALRVAVKDKGKEREKIDRELINLRRLKSEIESGISSQEMPEESSAELKSRHKDLLSETSSREKRVKVLEKEVKGLKGKIERVGVEKNSIRSKIKEIKYGRRKTELNKIESDKGKLVGEMAALRATLENALIPERENIEKVVGSLSKERGEFEEQIKREETRSKVAQKELVGKEKEEKEFYGQLKKLFGEKTKLSDMIKKAHSDIREFELSSTGENEEFNSLSIAKAKVDSELSGLKEELEPYSKVKVLAFLKTVQAAKQKQSEIQRKINSLGNVNMKALEIYDNVKKEWDKLNWRLTKLGSERGSIEDVINTIETKKKSVFMGTFTSISKNFARIYSNINNDVVNGDLLLENPEKPFEGGVKVKVVKPGASALSTLSGGERAIIALSFLFAVAEHQPSPFYLLDEIDSALDGVNVEKMAELLKKYSDNAQIVIVSHKDSVMSTANILHGIWMNKKRGESYVSSMKVK